MASNTGVPQPQAKSPADELLLAVDAGGTKTAAWLVDLKRPGTSRILGRGRAAAGNPLSVGLEDATRALTEAIATARGDAKRPRDQIGRLILSIAGAANEAIGKQFVDWVRPLGMAEQVAVVSDVLPVLAAGTPQCIGVALIAGTGSVAFGRNARGRTQLCGGWGYLLGDEGSGYFVGQQALAHALKNLEGNSASNPLAVAVLNALGAESIMDVTKAVYTSSDPRATIASLAPIVVDAADDDQPEAETIIDAAGMHLAELVARTAGSIGLTGSRFPLAVGGGLLGSSTLMQESVARWLQKHALECEISVVEEPLAGCVRLSAPEFAGTLVKWHDT
jgi:N-acetylglucosamine kinase-like BadF-type ATPase